MTQTPVTLSMYEERSFMRDPNLTLFLTQILDSLGEYNFVLEASLIKGVEIWVCYNPVFICIFGS